MTTLIAAAAAIHIVLQQAPAANVNWDKEFGIETKMPDPTSGEVPVDDYEQSDANAGGQPYNNPRIIEAFGGRDGIRQIAFRTVELSKSDPRISDIFVAHDMVRLKRTLDEQFCYLLGAGCAYSGRDMRTAHEGMGITKADLNALVANLQVAMREAEVPFAAQNRLLAKLAAMADLVLER